MRGTKKIDWLNHFLEFIVVVIGILLAFQLNTCRGEKQENKLVEGHVENLIEETLFNKSQIKTSLEASENLLEKLDTLIKMTGDQDFNTFTAHVISMELMSLDYMYLKRNAYNSLVETGDIRFMEDAQLQKEIVSLYEYYNWLEAADTSTRTLYLENYLPYATENFDLINYQPQAAEVYSNKLYRNYLSVYQYSVRLRLQKQEDLLKIVDDFLENNTIRK
jgi:hypothetical protein